MAEEKVEEEKIEEETAPAASPKVDEAKEVLKKIEAENKRSEELLEKLEAEKAERVISGQSEAGAAPEKLSKEDEIKARANEKLAGTGLEI